MDAPRRIRGSNTTADHVTLVNNAIAALPPPCRRKLMITADGAGASHGLIEHLDKLAARRGYEVTYSVGWVLTGREKDAIRLVPEQAWEIAVDGRGEVRERRADGACAGMDCGPSLLDRGSARHRADQPAALRSGRGSAGEWPATTPVFAREPPHRGAKLSLLENEDGWRYTLWVTNLPEKTMGWRGSRLHRRGAPDPRPRRRRDPHREGHRHRPVPVPRLQGEPGVADRRDDRPDPAHLAQAPGPRRRPCESRTENAAVQVLHAAARLVHGGRRRRLKIAANWPWAEAITRAWQRIHALPQPT